MSPTDETGSRPDHGRNELLATVVDIYQLKKKRVFKEIRAKTIAYSGFTS